MLVLTKSYVIGCLNHGVSFLTSPYCALQLTFLDA